MSKWNGCTLYRCSGSCRYCLPAYLDILRVTILLLVGKYVFGLKRECQRDVPRKNANVLSNASPILSFLKLSSSVVHKENVHWTTSKHTYYFSLTFLVSNGFVARLCLRTCIDSVSILKHIAFNKEATCMHPCKQVAGKQQGQNDWEMIHPNKHSTWKKK